MGRLVAGILLSLSFAALLGTGSAIRCIFEVSGSAIYTGWKSQHVACERDTAHCYQILTAKYVARYCGQCRGRGNCTDCLSDFCNKEQYSAAPPKFQCVEHDPGSGDVAKRVAQDRDCNEAACKWVVTDTNVKRGCGKCSEAEKPNCKNCTANLCNAVRPRIRCYAEDSANETLKQRRLKICSAAETHCKQILNETRTVRDCGACSGEPGCTDCLFDLCNEQEYSRDSKPLTCVEEATGDATQNKTRTDTQCKPNEKCMQLITDEVNKVKRGCGDCSAEADRDKPNCLTCNSNLCNYFKPRLQCYVEDSEANKSTKKPKLCPAHADTHCKQILTATSVKRDCGKCDREESEESNCIPCSSNLCNDRHFLLSCNSEIIDTVNPSRNRLWNERDCEANVTYCKEILNATLVERGCGRCGNTPDCRECSVETCNDGASKITVMTSAPRNTDLYPWATNDPDSRRSKTKTSTATTTSAPTPQGTTTTPKSRAAVRARPTLAVLLAALTCLATLL